MLRALSSTHRACASSSATCTSKPLPKLCVSPRCYPGSKFKSPRTVLTAAQAGEGDITLPVVNVSVSDNVYLRLEVAVLTAQLALVDAAYSGDWSRIGVITPEVEVILQKVVIFIIIAHSVVAALTVNLARKKEGVPLVSAAVKGFLFGTMELYKVSQCPDAQENGSSKKAVVSKSAGKRAVVSARQR